MIPTNQIFQYAACRLVENSEVRNDTVLVSDEERKNQNDKRPRAFTNSSDETPMLSKEPELEIFTHVAAHLKSRATIANVSSLDVLCTLCPVSNPGHVFDVLLDPGVLPVVF